MESTKEKYIALLKDAKIDMNKTDTSTEKLERLAIKRNIYTSVVKDLEQLERPWISVKDELPENGNLVLCFVVKIGTDAMSQYTLFYSDELKFTSCMVASFETDKRKVTHWMPLPEPPKNK